MRRDLRDKIETLPPERQEKIKARTKDLIQQLEEAPYTSENTMSEHEWSQVSWEAAEEIKKLRAENAVLKEEIRLREVIMGKKRRGTG